MGGYPDEQVAELRASWAGREVENLALARAYVVDHPELQGISEGFGLADHPGLLAMAAAAARRDGYSWQAPGQLTQQRRLTAPAPASQGDLGLEAELDTLREQQREAMDRGLTTRANELYVREQAMLASRRGNREIVNGKRTA